MKIDHQNCDSLGQGEEKSDNKMEEDTEAAPALATGKKRLAAGKDSVDLIDEEKLADLDHDTHLFTERERRKKMRDMFANLQALLPQLPYKADKSTIVDEAINHIKKLEKTLEKLEKKKLENQLHSAIPNPTVLAAKSREAFLADQGSSENNSTNAEKYSASSSLQSTPAFSQTWTCPHMSINICGQDAQISICCPKKTGLFSAICYLLEKFKLEVVSAQVSSDHQRNMYMIQTHVNEEFPVEEIYKQAAGEMMIFLNSQFVK